MAAIALVALATGTAGFALMIACAGAVLAWEWTRLCGGGRFGALGVILAAVVVAAAALGWRHVAWIGVVACAAGAVLVYVVAAIDRAHPGWAALGALWIGWPCVALVWLRDQHGGSRMILWLLVTVWATDIGAYFAGRIVGGPRLAPRISPNKTWAGLAGAIFSSAVVGIVASLAMRGAPAALALAIGGATLAVIAQAGDLGESWIKRRFGAKDSSDLIPGHGGLFDRVDGLLAAALALALWQWTSGGGILAWQ